MYCGNCGTKIEDNASVCPNCNKQITLNPVRTEVAQPETPPIVTVSSYSDSNKREKLPTSITLALAIVSGLFALFVVLVLFVFIFGGGGLEFYCEDIPPQTSAQSIIIEGTIESSGSDATLYLNGEVIETVSPREKQKSWNESVVLEAGKNTFVVTLTDGNGNSKSTVLNTEKNDNLIYPEGTVLNLTTVGVYIRPTPSKSDKFVVMLWDKSIDLVCLGEEATDLEGYVWFKVNTPSNGAGWVRQDLVKVK